MDCEWLAGIADEFTKAQACAWPDKNVQMLYDKVNRAKSVAIWFYLTQSLSLSL